MMARVTKLSGIAASTAKMGTPDRDRELAFVSIETLAAWSTFVRCYYLSCCLGATTTSGHVVTTATAFPTAADAIRYAALHLKGKRLKATWNPLEEPTWRQTTTLTRIAPLAGFSNLGQITAAFTLPTTVFDDLPSVRNFYAHRCHDSFVTVDQWAQSKGFPQRKHATHVLDTHLAGRPQSVMSDWLDEISMTVNTLCH